MTASGVILTLRGTGKGAPAIESLRLTDERGAAIPVSVPGSAPPAGTAPETKPTPETGTAAEEGIATGTGTAGEAGALTETKPNEDGPAPAAEIPVPNDPSSASSVPALTKAEREKGLIILKIGGAGAVYEGGIISIDPGNDRVTPYIDNARTLVPLRFIAEGLGADVEWFGADRRVLVELDGVVVEMRVGATEYTVGGETKYSEAAPDIREDRTFVPIRFIAEAFGRDVFWDDSERLVIIAPAELPWRPEREAEQAVRAAGLLLLSSADR
jgi:hypothetical protein